MSVEVDALVSIVIPCYNQGLFLEEALASCEHQTYQPIEVIVVDDGSGEDTRAILGQLAARYRFRLIRQDNRGLSAARNRGIEAAQGRYILPLDADNYLSPDAVALLVERLRQAQADNPRVMFVYQDKVLFGSEDRYVPHQSYNLYRLLTDNFADACSLLDRRVFDAGLRYNETMKKGYEDWEFHLRLGLYSFQGVRLAGKTFFYRRWGYSMVNAADAQKRALLNKIESELAALYIPAHRLAIKRQWAPGMSILTPHADALRDQTLTDTERVLYQPDDFASLLSALQTAKGKYLVLLTTRSPDTWPQDPAALEKWATLEETRDDIAVLVLMDADNRVRGYIVRAAFWAQEIAPRLPGDWAALHDALTRLGVARYWDVSRQRLLPAGQTASTLPARREKKISRAIKNWGKRVIAPRVGFDNAYQVFYHTYQAGQAFQRALRSRRATRSPASPPAAAAEPNPAQAGERIDQGFRHYTAVLFEGGHAPVDGL